MKSRRWKIIPEEHSGVTFGSCPAEESFSTLQSSADHDDPDEQERRKSVLNAINVYIITYQFKRLSFVYLI